VWSDRVGPGRRVQRISSVELVVWSLVGSGLGAVFSSFHQWSCWSGRFGPDRSVQLSSSEELLVVSSLVWSFRAGPQCSAHFIDGAVGRVLGIREESYTLWMGYEPISFI
jgi:hypothetical protein